MNTRLMDRDFDLMRSKAMKRIKQTVSIMNTNFATYFLLQGARRALVALARERDGVHLAAPVTNKICT